MIAKMNSIQVYAAQALKDFGLEYKPAGNMYIEISNPHFDSKTKSFTTSIDHVYNFNKKFYSKKPGGFWCSPANIIETCKDPTKPVAILQ